MEFGLFLQIKPEVLLSVSSTGLREKQEENVFQVKLLLTGKAERPKVSIYPHQSDYCDFCSKVKTGTQALQQQINRALQSGNVLTDDVQEHEKNKEVLEQNLQDHRTVARESLQYYHQMKVKCSRQWKELTELEKVAPSAERNETLQQLYTMYLLTIEGWLSKNFLLIGATVLNQVQHTTYERIHTTFLALLATVMEVVTSIC